MKSRQTGESIQQLLAIYTLREKKALAAISNQRQELSGLLEKLSEQKQLIATLQSELSELHELRSVRKISDMSSQSLQAESVRRRWLNYDLEQEVFYLPGFVSDVRKASQELKVRQGNWARLRATTKALQERKKSLELMAHLGRLKREDAELEERLGTGVVDYG